MKPSSIDLQMFNPSIDFYTTHYYLVDESVVTFWLNFCCRDSWNTLAFLVSSVGCMPSSWSTSTWYPKGTFSPLSSLASRVCCNYLNANNNMLVEILWFVWVSGWFLKKGRMQRLWELQQIECDTYLFLFETCIHVCRIWLSLFLFFCTKLSRLCCKSVNANHNMLVVILWLVWVSGWILKEGRIQRLLELQ